MVISSGIRSTSTGQTVDETPLDEFIRTLSNLPAEEWQKRIAALEKLVTSTPDYSTTSSDEDGAGVDISAILMSPSSQHYNIGSVHVAGAVIPWYRSSKAVRRLATPLKTLLLDARSAVVKEATELIGTLMMVKLQPHPSTTKDAKKDGVDEAENDSTNKGADHSNNGEVAKTPPRPKASICQHPPPAFVGRLLLKDLIPAILQLSAQTVKVIRTYGVSMTLDILPHCRVKSCLVILLERMKSDKNRSAREDCARYLRCVLETWPWDPSENDALTLGSNNESNVVTSRKEERLSLESARQVGLGLGRALSDPAQPVRNEAKKGFQILFTRFRPVWDEVMNAGVIRDVRLRKNLLEAASRSDGNIFDDVASTDDTSFNSLGRSSHASARSDMSRSYASYHSYASRGVSSRSHQVPGVPSVIRPGSSPSYLRGTVASSKRDAEQEKDQSEPSPRNFSVDTYVTTSGQVLTKRSPRNTPSPKHSKPSTPKHSTTTPAQPFASLLKTPQTHSTPAYRMTRRSPDSGIGSIQKSSKVLRKRLSSRITGINETLQSTDAENTRSHLTSINESEDTPQPSPATDAHSSEIVLVASEVIAAHKLHIGAVESAISREKEILLELEKQLGVSFANGIKNEKLAELLTSLTEEQVCDYFESVHVCVDKQRIASEMLLKEMERISQGDDWDACFEESKISSAQSEHAQRRNLAQSPMVGGDDLGIIQKDLEDAFASTPS